jgi:hypothetical protein
MIVNVAHRAGDGLVLEQIDSPVAFEGGQAHQGVLATFELNGDKVTARIIQVLPHDPEGEPAVVVELVDQDALDIESEVTLARLPPDDDFSTDI